MPELNLYCQSLGWDSGKMGVLMVGLGIVDSRIRLLLWCAVGGLFSVALYGTGQVTAAASPGPLGQPISDSLPPAPKKKARLPSQMPESTPAPAPIRQSPNRQSGGLGSPTGGMGQPNEVQVDARSGRYPSFGQGDDSYGIEMSLWPEDMETVNGLLQWRVNIVRFSPSVSSNYRTPLRPDGFVSGVGSVAATMSLTQNGTCISVLSIDGAPMTQIEVACSRGPGLMFRVLKLPHQTRWIVVSAVYRETEGTPTVVREFLADMWTNKVWPVSDFRAEGFTVEPCSNEAKVLWNSVSAQRLGLRVNDCLSTVLWPLDEGRLAGRAARQSPMLAPVRAETPSAQNETATWKAGYRDNFVSGAATVTTRSLARERNFPTSDGSKTLRELQAGTTLSGRWVLGRDQTSRWLKLTETGGYVWEGNLAVSLQDRMRALEPHLWNGNLDLQDASGAALAFAYLADAAYSASTSSVKTPDGRVWTYEGGWQDILKQEYAGRLPPKILSDYIEKLGKSGFYAALYSSDGQYVLTFRGTEGWKNIPDVATDVLQVFWLPTTQYDVAADITKYIAALHPNLILTGHSLGGGMAQYSAAQNSSNTKAVVFNAAGLQINNMVGNGDKVVNFSIDNDPVSAFGGQWGNRYTLPSNKFDAEALTSTSWLSLPGKLYLEGRSLFNAHTAIEGTPMQGIIGSLTNEFIFGKR